METINHLSNCSTSWEEDSSDLNINRNSALSNPIILECIFGFLPMNQIKLCRFVCQRWNYVAEPTLRKRSLICFDLTTGKSLADFNATFTNAQTNVAFTNIKLKNHTGGDTIKNPRLALSWHSNYLTEIFKQLGPGLKTLVFIGIKIGEISRFHIFWPSYQSTLTSLTVVCRSDTQIQFSVDHLESIKFLKLYNNTILDIGSKGKKITPKLIILEDVTILQNNKILQAANLNDFIDFSKATKIIIISGDRTDKFFLDARENLNVDYLKLSGVEQQNISEAQWNVKKGANLSGIPLDQLNGLQFSTLTTLNFKSSTIDLSILPQTIEFLILKNPVKVFCSSPVRLDNLKYLSVSYFVTFRNISSVSFNVLSCLRNFNNCRNLTEVYISLDENYGEVPKFTLNTSWIPESVKRLKLNRMLKLIDEKQLELESLILTKWKLRNAIETVNKITLKYLVFDIGKYTQVNAVFNMIKTLIPMKQNQLVIFVGPLKLKNISPLHDIIEHLHTAKPPKNKGENVYSLRCGRTLQTVAPEASNEFRLLQTSHIYNAKDLDKRLLYLS